MVASNTRACFEEFVGQEVVGVLFDALPVSRKDIAAGTKTLVFEDGRGLTIASNGSFWIHSKKEVDRAIRLVHSDLEQTRRNLEGVLTLAGAQGVETA